MSYPLMSRGHWLALSACAGVLMFAAIMAAVTPAEVH